MPELPEVETVVSYLHTNATGLQIAKVQVIRPQIISVPPAELARALVGYTFQSFTRQGKYIIGTLATGYHLIVHLRMTGQLVLADSATPQAKHTHLVIYFTPNCPQELRFSDQRRFGRIELIAPKELEGHKPLAKLGPDALSIGHTELWTRLQKIRRSIKAALLDQTVLAGMGNIYVDESLFRARIAPSTISNTITLPQAQLLTGEIHTVLQESIAQQGTTISDFVTSTGHKGNFQNFLRVYGRKDQPCSTCKATIIKTKLAGRGTYYCPKCQQQ